MGTDPTNNRSSAFTPEQLAQITELNTKMVNETVATIFASLAPALANMAITPEKLREANRPWEDPGVEARKKRERLQWKQDEDARIKQDRKTKDECRHMDVKGQTAIRLIRNFPDRQPRGICMHCHDLIHPKEWRIGAPDEKNPRGKAYICEPHKDYLTVLHIAAHE
jgi:hypothetical protein